MFGHHGNATSLCVYIAGSRFPYVSMFRRLRGCAMVGKLPMLFWKLTIFHGIFGFSRVLFASQIHGFDRPLIIWFGSYGASSSGTSYFLGTYFS